MLLWARPWSNRDHGSGRHTHSSDHDHCSGRDRSSESARAHTAPGTITGPVTLTVLPGTTIALGTIIDPGTPLLLARRSPRPPRCALLGRVRTNHDRAGRGLTPGMTTHSAGMCGDLVVPARRVVRVHNNLIRWPGTHSGHGKNTLRLEGVVIWSSRHDELSGFATTSYGGREFTPGIVKTHSAWKAWRFGCPGMTHWWSGHNYCPGHHHCSGHKHCPSHDYILDDVPGCRHMHVVPRATPARVAPRRCVAWSKDRSGQHLLTITP